MAQTKKDQVDKPVQADQSKQSDPFDSPIPTPSHWNDAQMSVALRGRLIGRTVVDCRAHDHVILIVFDTGQQLEFPVEEGFRINVGEIQ